MNQIFQRIKIRKNIPNNKMMKEEKNTGVKCKVAIKNQSQAST
jgi:hypothetical protein